MLTFVIYALVVIIALALLGAAFRELGFAMRGFAVVTRGVMEALGVRPETAATPRQRFAAVVLTMLIIAGLLAALVLAVRWLFA